MHTCTLILKFLTYKSKTPLKANNYQKLSKNISIYNRTLNSLTRVFSFGFNKNVLCRVNIIIALPI